MRDTENSRGDVKNIPGLTPKTINRDQFMKLKIFFVLFININF